VSELEERWQDLGAFIREQRRVGQLSLRKLSERAGISNPYLSQIERGLRKPSAEILQNIARALQISAETLYVRAGILEERNGDVDLIAELRRAPGMTQEQKKTLVHIYESFRRENAALHPETAIEDDQPLVGDSDEVVDVGSADAVTSEPEAAAGSESATAS